MAIQEYKADLHIHTCLSPCAEIEMIPSLIVAAALQARLDIIAITDHNSCENAGAVIEASKGTGLKVVPGMEVQSVEGVHILCLFDELDSAISMQEVVYESLPEIPGAGKFYNQQMVVDCSDEFVKYCTIPISLPTKLDIDTIYEKATSLGGLVIPSHIDRLETGICGVLGMLPDTPEFAAVEVSRNLNPKEARLKYREIGSRPIFSNSDSHWLSMIGERRTLLYLEHRSVAEIKLACAGEGGRRIENA